MKTASLVASVSRKAGGLFESVRRLHQELARLPGVSVSVLSLRDGFTDEDIRSWAPLPVRAFEILGPAPFGFSPKLNRAMSALDEEILHTHGIWMYPSVATRNWHRQTKRPYLISPHGMLDPWALQNSAWKKRTALWLYENEHLRNAACIRALCQSEAESIRKFGLRNPVCVIPNGVDVPEDRPSLGSFGPASRTSVFRCSGVSGGGGAVIEELKAEGRKVLLYLGRIHPKKGLVNLLRAWSEVQRTENRPERIRGAGQRIGEWVLAIAGWDQGAHEAELKRLATELGIRWMEDRPLLASFGPASRCFGTSVLQCFSTSVLRCLRIAAPLPDGNTEAPTSASVVFLGPQFNEDSEACYRNCDAFVLPSFSEGLPIAVLQAWAYGKPVLMTPECNLPEGFVRAAAIRIETGASGPQRSGNRETIEHGLRELFAMDSNLRIAMGERGRALVIEHFSWPKIAVEMKDVYEWVLGGGPPPSCLT